MNEKGYEFKVNEATDNINNYIKFKELKGYMVVIASKDGIDTYLLCKDMIPIFENTSVEAIGCRIDIIKANEEFK